MAKKKQADHEFIGCTIKQLPPHLAVAGALNAVKINPVNAPPKKRVNQLLETLLAPGFTLQPEHLAVITTKYWNSGGVKLTVGFLDSAPLDLQNRILLHMNAWGQYCNVQFTLSATDPQVRIARTSDGYWSYLGTDILSIPRNQQTMNLQGFTMNTPESEFHRVVRHETGHTLGFPHEHLRAALVSRLDPKKTIQYFQQTQGWSPQVTTQQVLTPLDESALMGTPGADQDSIMCYQLPGSITKDGQPIRGGLDIDMTDQVFVAKVYPKANDPGTGGGDAKIWNGVLDAGTYQLTKIK